MLIKEENYSLDSLLENKLNISNNLYSTINQIPVVYNEEGNYCLVKYRDIEELQEQYNFNINNAVSCISDFNNIDTNSVVLTVNESDIIEYPEIANNIYDKKYVIDPIPMDNPTVQLCDYLVEEALETGDESCLDVLEEDYTVVNEVLDKLTPEEKENLKNNLKSIRIKNKLKTKEMQSNMALYASNNGATKQQIDNFLSKSGKKINRRFIEKDEIRKKMIRDAVGKNNRKNNLTKVGIGIASTGAAAFAIKNRKSIINRIKGLRAKSDQLEQKMQAAPVEKKGLFRRIIDKIKSIIQKLIAKLRENNKGVINNAN